MVNITKNMFITFFLFMLSFCYAYDIDKYLSSKECFVELFNERFPDKKNSLEGFLQTVDLVYQHLQQDDYVLASEYVQKQIKRQSKEAKNIADLELLIGLVKIDSAIDAFYYKKYRSCVEKNYIVCCFYSMLYDSIYMNDSAIHNYDIYESIPSTVSILNRVFVSDRQASRYFDEIYDFIKTSDNRLVRPSLSHPIFNAFQTPLTNPVFYTKEQFLDSVIICLYYCSDFNDDLTLFISNEKDYSGTYDYIQKKMNRDYPVEISKYYGLYIFCLFKKERAMEYFTKYYSNDLPKVFTKIN